MFILFHVVGWDSDSKPMVYFRYGKFHCLAMWRGGIKIQRLEKEQRWINTTKLNI